jgi:hypothetical protein
VFGFAVEITIGSSNLYNATAELITNGLWNGAEALATALETIAESVARATNPFDGRMYDRVDLGAFEYSPDPEAVNRIDPNHVDLAAFETMPMMHEYVQVEFYGNNPHPTLEPQYGMHPSLEPMSAETHPII